MNLLVIFFILFVCIFEFLPKPIQTMGFLFILFYSIYYVWIFKKQINHKIATDKETKKLVRLFVFFVCLSAFYLTISFINLPLLWGIKDLAFEISYIPRHFFIIAELFIPIVLSLGVFRLKLYNRFSIPILVVFLLFLFFVIPGLNIIGLFLITITIIAWKCHSKLMMLLAFFVNYEQSSYILGFIAMIFLLFLEKRITTFLFKNTRNKIIIILSITIFVLFITSGILMIHIQDDSNSLWRLIVWINEINSLSETYFTGVGFGSAYVTDNIVNEVENSNMYFDQEGGFEGGVFLVANHCSLLNMFYRMGLLGGLLFLAMNVQIISIVVKLYRYADKKMSSLLWRFFSVFIYQTVVVFLNPGLEMMQFALSYILSLSFLFAVILDIQSQQKLMIDSSITRAYE